MPLILCQKCANVQKNCRFKIFCAETRNKILAENYAPPWKISWWRPWDGKQSVAIPCNLKRITAYVTCFCVKYTKIFSRSFDVCSKILTLPDAEKYHEKIRLPRAPAGDGKCVCKDLGLIQYPISPGNYTRGLQSDVSHVPTSHSLFFVA